VDFDFFYNFYFQYFGFFIDINSYGIKLMVYYDLIDKTTLVDGNDDACSIDDYLFVFFVFFDCSFVFSVHHPVHHPGRLKKIYMQVIKLFVDGAYC